MPSEQNGLSAYMVVGSSKKQPWFKPVCKALLLKVFLSTLGSPGCLKPTYKSVVS